MLGLGGRGGRREAPALFPPMSETGRAEAGRGGRTGGVGVRALGGETRMGPTRGEERVSTIDGDRGRLRLRSPTDGRVLRTHGAVIFCIFSKIPPVSHMQTVTISIIYLLFVV